MLAAIRQIIALLPKGRGGLWGNIALFAVLVSATEALTAGLVFQLIRIIDNPLQFLERLRPWALFSFVQGWSAAKLIGVAAFLTMGMYVVRSALSLLEVYMQSRFANEEAGALSLRLLSRYTQAPYTFHLQRNSSEILHEVFQNIRAGFVLSLVGVIGIASECFMMLALLGVLLIIAPALTLGLILFLGIMLLILMGPVQRWTQRWGSEGHNNSTEAFRHLQQLLLGFKEVKMSGRETHFLEEFSRHELQYGSVRKRLETIMQMPRTVIEITFSAIACAAIVYMLSEQWPTEKIIALLGIYVYVVFRVMPSLNRLSNYISQVRYYQTAIKMITDELIHLEKTVEKVAPVITTRSFSFENAIELQDVMYTYPGQETAALHHISLTIQRGDFIGIIGTTGAGKSTLVDVLLGLLEPQAGCVLVDGKDIAQNLRGWQSKIGYVPQSIYLLDDTLANNIYFGTSAPHETRLWEVIRMAQLDSFVQTLPQGIATVVGEQGIRLSGGERQRIAIARALYHNPEILIFDEATASLDNETERRITETILGIRREKTIVMIAHRLSTVESCDRLILLKEGSVAAIDAYHDLLRYQADFQKLVGAA